MGKHERCPHSPNQYVKHYAQRLGSFALNTAQVIQHEVWPPKPEVPPIPRSELVILDDENAVIRVEEN